MCKIYSFALYEERILEFTEEEFSVFSVTLMNTVSQIEVYKLLVEWLKRDDKKRHFSYLFNIELLNDGDRH